MKKSKQVLSGSAWVSLFWARYNRLSEPFKEGFSILVQNIAVETTKKEQILNNQRYFNEIKI